MLRTQKQAVWNPTQEMIRSSNMVLFMNYVKRRYHIPQLSTYKELYDWSVKFTDKFWECIWDYAGIIHSEKYTAISDATTPSYLKVPRPIWFPGAKLNFAENLLRFQDDHRAIISYAEKKEPVYISYGELYDKVARAAIGLKKLGVGPGDRVAALITNIPEAIIGMLAASSLGAVWSSTSPDFGFKGVMDRFGQIEPKVLITINGYSYNGKDFDCTEKVSQIVDSLPNLVKCVLIDRIDSNTALTDGLKAKSSYMTWDELCKETSEEIEFEQLPFDHPLYIMYSSGTTGTPKCIVHGQGGTLLQHYKELHLHTNLNRDEIIFYYTTCGWMMWNWLVSSLMVGATVFLYDGSPSFPNLNVLWEAAQEEQINIFGTSPKYLAACQQAKIKPQDDFILFNLRAILSTGAPLPEETYLWIITHISKNIQISSISGGTDIISCFMLGNPMLPVYPGEIQSRGLGMKVFAFDTRGADVVEQKGELVCANAFPSMPIYFWNDPDNEKYRNSYFNNFRGVWRHGDFIMVTEEGGVVVYGRSDATLNPGGVRIGTSEIYRLIDTIEEIQDSVAISQKSLNTPEERIILFVVMKEGIEFNSDITQNIRKIVRQEATTRHVPSVIMPVKDIPVTLNGKKVEIAVYNIINKLEVTNIEALANPESLEEYKEITLPEFITSESDV